MKRAFFIADERVHLSLVLSAFICGKMIFLAIASWELNLRLLHWPKSDIIAIQIHH
jgi:hypothetical protein